VLAINEISIGPPMPQISALASRDNLNLEVTWAEGLRKGKREIVDLSPLIKSFKFYRGLLQPSLFATARLEDGGQTVVWSSGADMAAMSIERLAEESMNATEFRAFLKTLDLTQDQAAALLGYGRRQIAHYVSGTKPIPRIVALACRRLLDTRSDHNEYVLGWSSVRGATANVIAQASMPVTVNYAPPHLIPNLHLEMNVTRSSLRYGT